MGMYDDRDDPRYDNRNRQQSPFSGLWVRIFIALAIAVVGWFMYISNVEENPITGEKQHVSITPAQEVQLGLQSAPQMSRQMGGELSSTDPRAQEVKKIGAYLVTNSQASKSPWKFQFHLLGDTKTINAFALPGGQVFITLALYNKLQNEAQLAGVLGHEMGHVIERHTAEQMAKNQLGQFLIMAVGTGAGSNPGQPGGILDPAVIASYVNQFLQLSYSRQDESEADVWGLKLMEKVGYDPTEMIKVMAVLKAASGGGGSTPEIFQTHPNPDLRIKQIQEYLKKNPPPIGLKKGDSIKHSSDYDSNQDSEGSLEDLFHFRRSH